MIACRRSSQLASSVVHQFRHAVATGTHRLSDTSGAAQDHNGSPSSDHSFTVGSPSHSTSSAPQLADESPTGPDDTSENHIAIDMESDSRTR